MFQTEEPGGLPNSIVQEQRVVKFGRRMGFGKYDDNFVIPLIYDFCFAIIQEAFSGEKKSMILESTSVFFEHVITMLSVKGES